MSAIYTPNKNLAEPQVNNDTGWGTTWNSNAVILDGAFGGATSLTSTTGTVVLTASQYQNLYLNISGSTTGSVTYQVPYGVGGWWIINNVATPNTNAILFGMATTSSTVTLPAYGGTQQPTIVCSDGTQVYIPSAAPVQSVIPSGTVMPFYQAGAPTGWTKVTTANDGVLRVVSGSTGGSGAGAVAFSTMFNVPNSGVTGPTALTIAELPSTVADYGTTGTIQLGTGTAGVYAQNSVGNQPHTHPLLALKYYDVIICSKN